MTPVLYEQSDFASPDETIAERRQRMYPQPTRTARLAVILPGIGLGLTFVLVLYALKLLVTV